MRAMRAVLVFALLAAVAGCGTNWMTPQVVKYAHTTVDTVITVRTTLVNRIGETCVVFTVPPPAPGDTASCGWEAQR